MKRVDSIISNDKNIVTSGAVAREFNTYFRCANVSIQIPERTNAKYLAIANSLPNGSSVYCMGIVQTYATDVGTAYHYDMISNNGNLSLSLNSNTGVLTSIGLEPSTISLVRFSSGLI